MDQGSLLRIGPRTGVAGEETDVLLTASHAGIEGIVSRGQATAPGAWYDQEHDEWVAVLQGAGVLAFEDGPPVRLGPGDWILLPAHRRHRVESTSSEPPCIWLAVFLSMTSDASVPQAHGDV